MAGRDAALQPPKWIEGEFQIVGSMSGGHAQAQGRRSHWNLGKQNWRHKDTEFPQSVAKTAVVASSPKISQHRAWATATRKRNGPRLVAPDQTADAEQNEYDTDTEIPPGEDALLLSFFVPDW